MQFVDDEAQEKFERALDDIRDHFGWPQPPGRLAKRRKREEEKKQDGRRTK